MVTNSGHPGRGGTGRPVGVTREDDSRAGGKPGDSFESIFLCISGKSAISLL